MSGMNPVPLAAWIQSSHLSVIGFCGAALTLGVVLAIAYRNSGESETDLDDGPTQRTAWAVARAILGSVATVTTLGIVITGFRTGLVALVAGVIAGVGLYYIHRKHKLEHKQLGLLQIQVAGVVTRLGEPVWS